MRSKSLKLQTAMERGKIEVLNELSKEILVGKTTTDSIILLDSFNDALVFRNQEDLVE